MKRRLTRRQLAAGFGAGVLAAVARQGLAGMARPGVVGTAVLPPDGVTPVRCRDSMAAAVAAAIGADSAELAVRGLFGPSDVVGIKVNCLGGPRLSPRVELVESLVELLATSGVASHRIIVFDRSSRELERAGFEVRRSGGRYLCFGTDNDYDRRPSTSGEIGSCFARLVSETCTALVSFGVVKDHDLAGVSAGLKNWYGVIHNPNKYHDSGCDPYVADVVRHPFVGTKLRLTVLDGVEAQCQGGPAFSGSWLYPLGTVAASTDPVAADLWAWREIERERERRGLRSLEVEKRAPRFIATTGRYGLGIGNPSELKVVSG